MIEFQVLLRVSGAVNRDLDKVDTNNIKPTHDNDSDINMGSTKHDHNTKGTPNDTDTKDNVQNDRHDNRMTHVNGPQRQMRLTINT